MGKNSNYTDDTSLEGGPQSSARLFSIGHSNIALETFIDLLRINQIDVLVDVRSHPYSKFAPHFGQDSLKQALHANGVEYIYLGKELGGKPESGEFYDKDGRVIYADLAKSPIFIDGIRRLELEIGVHYHCVVLMCSEEDPKDCHRRLLIGRVLAERGIMGHIRDDGYLQTRGVLKRRKSLEGVQIPLFELPEYANWCPARPMPVAALSVLHCVTLEHIRADGRLQTEEDLKHEESGEGAQLAMFELSEYMNWRSVKRIRSASPSDEHQTFLEH